MKAARQITTRARFKKKRAGEPAPLRFGSEVPAEDFAADKDADGVGEGYPEVPGMALGCRMVT